MCSSVGVRSLLLIVYFSLVEYRASHIQSWSLMEFISDNDVLPDGNIYYRRNMELRPYGRSDTIPHPLVTPSTYHKRFALCADRRRAPHFACAPLHIFRVVG